MASDFYVGPLLLWTTTDMNFEEVRKIIKSEFKLVEAHHEEDTALERSLVFPHPEAQNDLMIYRVKFRNTHEYGPFIDFKYDSLVTNFRTLDRDLRAEAVSRTSELVRVVTVTDWLMNVLNLPYVRFSAEH